MTSIEILDGANVIGGSKILLNSSNGSILLDFGMNFKTFSNYFEEYLRPRSSRGLKDLIKMKLLPPISGLYRNDLFPEDLVRDDFLLNKSISGVFLSHAHVDHSGCIGYLRGDIPIYASALTIKILEVMQTTTKSDFVRDCYFIKEKALCDDGLSMKAKGGKKLRPFVTLNDGDCEIGPYRCKFFSVDHSIWGASSLAIETESGWVVYSGDLRLHGVKGELTKKFIESVAKLHPKALIIEGTRITSDKKITEDEVFENSLTAVMASSGKLIIADFGPRNIERLETFLKIVKETSRKIVINIKDAYLLDLLKEDGFNIIDDDNLFIICEKKSKEKKCLNEVKNKYDEKLITIEDINKNLGEFILCYSFWDLTNLLDIDLKDGIYIYSSSEAYSEEQEFDIKRLFNWLHYFNLEPFGIELTNDKPKFSGNFHSSGHASYKDIKFMIDEINPEFIIPVHTEKLEIFKNLYGNKVIEKEYFEL
jgi:ribonuclease J